MRHIHRFVTDDGQTVDFIPEKRLPGFTYRIAVNGTLTRSYLGADHRACEKTAKFFLQKHGRNAG